MSASRALRIVIFEDSALFLERLGEHIAEIPQTKIVAKASMALGAANLIRDCRPDMILIDFSLAEGTALDVLRSIREAGSSAVAIVMTSDGNPAVEEACRALGAKALIEKSVLSEAIDGL